MFESLSEKLGSVFKKLRSKGRLTDKDIDLAMREVRTALLDADVNFKVTKAFCAQTAVLCKGQDVLEGLNPAQMIVKIVKERLTLLMGAENAKIQFASKPPTIVLMAGLQGAGKTTNTAKLAGHFKRQGKRPLLVACDVYRPAAIQQLQTVGEQVGVPVFEQGAGDPVQIAKNAIEQAKQHGNDLVFLDTAGRLHIDETLMDELKRINTAVEPHEIILTIDAMVGQDAVNSAKAFDEQLPLTGVLLTKLDGDARGGAALSVREVTGKPIKFIGTGEKLDQIEPFYPERMASRILGMGDIESLIEKAEAAMDEKKSAELEERLRKGRFTLTDFYDQLGQIKSMGNMKDLVGMIPGMDSKMLAGAEMDERATAKIEALILSMTPKERENPAILNSSRKRRITLGSGTKVEDLNRLLKQFDMMKSLVKQMSGGGMPNPLALGGKMKMKKMGKKRKGRPF